MWDTLARRLFVRVVINPISGCWEYSGARNADNYGLISANGGSQLAHRICYFLFNGEIPVGHDLHHTCENPPCVNPAHLESLTRREHITTRRNGSWSYSNAQKTHCKHGHPLTVDNLVPSVLARGHRKCATCNRAEKRRWYCRRRVVSGAISETR